MNSRKFGNKFRILCERRSLKKGRLLIVSAPSGTGKTTVVESLLKGSREIKRSVSFTTRSPRTGEKNGRDYHFISKSDFLKKRRSGFFLEWAKVFGNFYGTSKLACLREMKRGRHVILTIDVQGMRKIKKRFSKSIPITTIFLIPPSLDTLKKRLAKRNTDSRQEVQKRLRMAKKEMKARHEYDHVLVNHDVVPTVKEIKRILKSINKEN